MNEPGSLEDHWRAFERLMRWREDASEYAIAKATETCRMAFLAGASAALRQMAMANGRVQRANELVEEIKLLVKRANS